MENNITKFLMAHPVLDNNYDFNFQASRQPPKGRGKILPGDEMILECDYETTGRQGTVLRFHEILFPVLFK